MFATTKLQLYIEIDYSYLLPADCTSFPLRHARVFLTVNMKPKTKRRLLAGASGQRFLEMNWELPHDVMNDMLSQSMNSSYHSDDWIGLFKGEPSKRESTSK